MPRQFSLKTLLWLMLVVGAFFGGIRFEQERRRRADESAALAQRSENAVINIPLIILEEDEALLGIPSTGDVPNP
jgi:hypothetical protein